MYFRNESRYRIYRNNDKLFTNYFTLYSNNLGPLAPDPPGELDVLGHNGDPLSMDGAQVGVLEQPNQISLTGFLESAHSGGLKPQISLKILSYFMNLGTKTKVQETERVRTNLWKGNFLMSSSVDFW